MSWLLSEDGSINSKTVKTPFGTMELTTVDNYGGYECNKEQTGLTQNQDLLDRVQDNIRQRFNLDVPSDNGNDY